MTVIATMLAGLSSSEMTRAQYDRSLAAQLQSKAGDQWSFFQAKKLRSALQHTTLDMIVSTAVVRAIEVNALESYPTAEGIIKTSAGREALAVLQGGKLPEPPASAPMDSKVAAAIDALEKSRSDPELNVLVTAVDDKVLETTLRAARDRALALDGLTSPLTRTIDQMESAISAAPAHVVTTADANPVRDFTAARLRFNAQRYDLEARHNQTIAELYEVQVRRNNISAERHHKRSGRFFYGMLAAQMAVIIATFALAARQRSFLWSIAAVAGTAAIGFAVYVYLYV